MHCVKLLSGSYPRLSHYPFLVISKSIRPPFCMCENVLSFLIVTERGSLWLGDGLKGCPYHLLILFVSLVRLHSCIYNWKKNGKCVRMQILSFKAEKKNWEEVLREFIPLPVCSSWWCRAWAQRAVCHCPKTALMDVSILSPAWEPMVTLGLEAGENRHFLSEQNVSPSHASTLGFELSLYLWPRQWPWAVLSVAVVQSLWAVSFSLC